jgi:excisionase family DNA binding protein
VTTKRKPLLKTFVTTREAARLLGVSLRTAQLWAENGLLSCWKTDGGHRRIPRDSVERLLVNRITDQRQIAGAAPDQKEARRDGSARGLRILVVEDEPTLLRMYRMQLARWEMKPEITTASNGFEALVRMGNTRPDLLIADLNMPEMDGIQMLHTLRRMPELDAMEVVVVTGLDPEDIARRGGLPDGIPVLPKPIQFTKLEKIAKRIAARLDR